MEKNGKTSKNRVIKKKKKENSTEAQEEETSRNIIFM